MATLTRELFGHLPDGRPVELYRLANRRGTVARILTYGGTLQALETADRQGRIEDIVLGFDTLPPYLEQSAFLGSLVGRYANRVAYGAFVLDGVRHQVPVTSAPHALHGGIKGFDKAVWRVAQADATADQAALRLVHRSPHGDQGFPGTLNVQATYALMEANELRLDFEATTDAPTIINLTSHAYWNLAGEAAGDALDHQVGIEADAFTAVDGTLIPTGEIVPVAGTPFDFRQARPIRAGIHDFTDLQIARGHGYDHNFILREASGAAPRLAARVADPASGRTLTVLTTEPGVQFYTGNFLGEAGPGKGGRTYRRHDGFCLETQHFPDSPNQPHFPSVVLRPGETFRSTTVFRFGVLP